MAITRYGFTGPMSAYGTFAPKDEGAELTTRRGMQARGRARKRGRAVWWLPVLLAWRWV